MVLPCKKRHSPLGLCLLFVKNYSAEIAPVGHSASQVPHSKQASASITYFPSPSEIASAGHAAAQEPQATHSSLITYAIVLILLEYFPIPISGSDSILI